MPDSQVTGRMMLRRKAELPNIGHHFGHLGYSTRPVHRSLHRRCRGRRPLAHRLFGRIRRYEFLLKQQARVKRHVHDHAGSNLPLYYRASQHKQPPRFKSEGIFYPKLGHTTCSSSKASVMPPPGTKRMGKLANGPAPTVRYTFSLNFAEGRPSYFHLLLSCQSGKLATQRGSKRHP